MRMFNVPGDVTAAVGMKVTDALPVPPFAESVRLVGEPVNSAFVLRVTVAEAAPVITTVIAFRRLLCATLMVPKSIDLGLTVMVGAAVCPVPSKYTTGGVA